MSKPRIVTIINNCRSDDTGKPFGIEEKGILYGDNRLLLADDSGLSVWELTLGKLEVTDETPCIAQINLPWLDDPYTSVDLSKLIDMSLFDFLDYVSSLEYRNKKRW
ncbi:hypothetical protein [Calidifontibacillus erzurumensis]|uniref:Uncharacterized protein n=1 Tax=Calidifontibacillus erzurumensis TaxID=2741433 RepID=A0A8J8GE64_9BACI|nr:hypothetical protein [Calidifontibacillus erzurumensis]NSL51717.1 hypothetical protein [Calidifontibacillus erzurumensis]